MRSFGSPGNGQGESPVETLMRTKNVLYLSKALNMPGNGTFRGMRVNIAKNVVGDLICMHHSEHHQMGHLEAPFSINLFNGLYSAHFMQIEWQPSIWLLRFPHSQSLKVYPTE